MLPWAALVTPYGPVRPGEPERRDVLAEPGARALEAEQGGRVRVAAPADEVALARLGGRVRTPDRTGQI